MKVLLLVSALALLQLVCPGSAKSVRLPANTTTRISMLTEMFKNAMISNATVPGHLRNATVPVMENCDKKPFCVVEQVLLKLADNEKIELLCRSVSAYNNRTHMNCPHGKLKMSDTVTFELQDFFIIFIECIRKEILSLPANH
ncbi:unnamed protein product [Lota lota]